MPVPGAAPTEYKSESVLDIAGAYYNFIFGGIHDVPKINVACV